MQHEIIKIRCKNTNNILNIPIGSSLSDIYDASQCQMTLPPLCAKVNNKVRGMAFRVYQNKDVEFLDITSAEGMRVYTRTLFFILSKAVNDLFPNGYVRIDTPISNGYYCDLRIGKTVSLQDVQRIQQQMKNIIDAQINIQRHDCTMEEAIQQFNKKTTKTKVKLLRTLGNLYTTYYQIGDYADYYYGPLLNNTAQITNFGLEKYYDGILLRIPTRNNPQQLGTVIRQDKMFDIFKEHHKWQDLLHIETIGDFNEAVAQGKATDIVNLSEALQEKKIANIAEDIAQRKNTKLVLIAGPSSSGKTTTTTRLCIQLLCNGIQPIAISLDDYFVDRTLTPRDENGDYDYESLYALNLKQLNQQLQQLFNGEKIQLPKYNFHTGKSQNNGKQLQLKENQILILEGIHALNPQLTAEIDDNIKYRIYASALTTILLDYHNYIPTTDNRLLRRIIRDHKYRGTTAEETLKRWPSVRNGENKWIFPFQENADAMFNSAMIYELGVIRQQALPLLQQVPENSPQYSEAHRLAKFLKYIAPISQQQLPQTSLLREFVGGSSFKY